MANRRKVRITAPYPFTHRFSVHPAHAGSSLLSMMSARFPFNTPKEWEARIVAGKVGVNGLKVFPGYILRENDTVFHFNPAVIEPSVPDEIEILEETSDYLAVFKPAPLPVHPGGRYYKNTLTNMLQEQGFGGLKVVHRLDAVTSGIIIFGKTKEFAQRAMQCFSNNKVAKTYHALVSGVPREPHKVINTPIKRKTGFVFESAPGLEHARSAETRFFVRKSFARSALIRCEPVTGRTHQIRLHLAGWGYPVIDDPVYGLHGDTSSRQTQNTGISLAGTGLKSAKLGISLEIPVPETWNGESPAALPF